MKKDKKRKSHLALLITMILAIEITVTSCANTEPSDNKGHSGQSSEEQDKSADKPTDEQDSKITFGAFTSQTIDGTEVTQDIFKEADVTMVNIWGTFCGPCIGEMPELGEISREYEGTGFQIIGMLCDVSEPENEAALEIIAATQADYTHIILSPSLQNGILGQVQVVPTTIFVDDEGNQVGNICTGAKDKNSWLKVIEEVLKEAGK